MACSSSEGCFIDEEVLQPSVSSSGAAASFHVPGLSSRAWRPVGV